MNCLKNTVYSKIDMAFVIVAREWGASEIVQYNSCLWGEICGEDLSGGKQLDEETNGKNGFVILCEWSSVIHIIMVNVILICNHHSLS